MWTSNETLNTFIRCASHAYNQGKMDAFYALLADIDRHFYPLSILPLSIIPKSEPFHPSGGEDSGVEPWV